MTDGATCICRENGGENTCGAIYQSLLSVAKTVVQRVRSNRWRFNFERAGRGGQINFLRKMAMIITITKASILIICPFPRGLLLTYPLSPPPTFMADYDQFWHVSAAFNWLHRAIMSVGP